MAIDIQGQARHRAATCPKFEGSDSLNTSEPVEVFVSGHAVIVGTESVMVGPLDDCNTYAETWNRHHQDRMATVAPFEAVILVSLPPCKPDADHAPRKSE